MPPSSPPQDPAPPDPKDDLIQIRLDADLAKQAKRKARSHGWKLSSVMRALLRLWVAEDVVSPEDVGAEDIPAGRKPKAKAKRTTKKR